ncbi:MAG: S9 family peptidase, partial [Acidobacteriota bacterium]|nr:S9 family peptidase [Acidobacteriota bacterium]
LADRTERALTVDGGEDLLYGRLDWVYQEELYGRGNFKGYWWSPDSSRLAFLKLDESPVGTFTIVDHLPIRLTTEVTRYPKAGDPNPRVSLGLVDVAGGESRWVDTSRYAPIEHLIVRVSWTPDSSGILFQVQDREQTWLDLDLAPVDGGEVRRLLRETSPAWVGVAGEPAWLDDGTFLWLSDRTGYRHVYRYDGEGRLLGAVTEGDWEVRELHGHDPRTGFAFLTATEHSPIETHVYRTRLDGTGLTRLTLDAGSHRAQFNEEFTLFLDRFSDVKTPPKLRLRSATGDLVRAVDENEIPALSRFEFGEVRFMQVPARDGFAMEAMMITPPDFDASRKYPVLQYNYGGPHAPVVRNRWDGRRYLWHQMLAQRGYVIWMCDNRSASGKGVKPAWEVYGQLGVVEMRDIEDGVSWLREQPYVDAERIGIWGWSYGGFMASYALTHSKSFKIGIAGAPVTDWRLYDTIYTERYMKRPQSNAEGYKSTSVVEAAGDLAGKLLIVHGTTDDNVHLQNTVKLVHALQQAGKEFELMIYPRSRHRVHDPNLLYHLQRLLTRFVEENL